jgi:hypothetical protein
MNGLATPSDRALRAQADFLRQLAASVKDSDPAHVRLLIARALKRVENRIARGLPWR